MDNASSVGGNESPICTTCDRRVDGDDAPATVYVHLQNGEVIPVSDVTGLDVTDTAIVLMRGSKPPIMYDRSRVYYACCHRDMQPPQC